MANAPKPISFGTAPLVQNPTVQMADPTAQLPAVVVTPTRPVRPMMTLDELNALGASTEVTANAISNKLVETAKLGDMGALGKGMGDLLVAGKKMSPSAYKLGGLVGLFGASFQKIKNRYDSASNAVDTLIAQTGMEVDRFKQRVTDYNHLHAQNDQMEGELADLVVYLDERIAEAEANPPAVDAADPSTVAARQEYDYILAAMKRKRASCHQLATLAQIQGPMIKQMQGNAFDLVQKFEELRGPVMRVLKQNFVIYLGQLELEAGAKRAQAQDKLFEDTIKANADMHARSTIAVATALNTPTIKFETLQYSYTKLTETTVALDGIRKNAELQAKQDQPRLEQLSRDIAAQFGK